jgi:putative membrane protein
MQNLLAQFARGYAMGMADLVPGVSGGTIALVLGIYRRLVASIRSGAGALGSLIRLDVEGFVGRLRQVEWSFLLPLVAGIGASVVTLSHLIEDLLEDHPIRMAGLFFGLVVASIVVAWRMVQRRDPTRSAVLVGVSLVTFWLLGYTAGTVENPTWWMFFGAGAIAICAMILPGISGSFLLLMMGMYAPVLGAVNDRRLITLAIFVAGIVIGLASFSTLLNMLLDRYYDTVMAALVGLMVGSLRVLWPWPDGAAGTDLAAPSDDIVGPILLALVGAVVVLAVTRREGALAEQAEAGGEAAEARS